MAPPAAPVLVVDDNLATAHSLAVYLRQCGYDVRAATTALDAVTALVGWTTEAAVIDLQAAGGCGLAAAEALAAFDRRPLLIALLRPDRVAAVPREKLAQFDHVFTKAASLTALGEAIARHMARKTVRLEGERPG